MRAVRLFNLLSGLLMFSALTPQLQSQTQQAPGAATPPVQLTAEQDHQRVMDQLHITIMQHGADNNDPKSPYAANYDESKANPYPTLPDALVLNNGKKVTSAKIWWAERRPQIVEYYDREVYGRVPKDTPSVKWEGVSTTKETIGDVPVITKKLTGRVDNSSYPLITVNIDLTLITPASATGPVPVIMEFSFDPKFLAELMKRIPAANRPAPYPGPTWQQQVLA